MLLRPIKKIVAIIQAEHIEAVRNIAAIVQTPGIDAVFIGPYDLSASMGKPGHIRHPNGRQPSAPCGTPS